MLDSARVIELFATGPGDGAGSGSVGAGYLLADDLVLTAAHVVARGGCEGRRLGEADWRPARELWRGDECDAALLEIPQMPVGTPVRFGRFMAGTPAPCKAVGFPASQKRRGKKRAVRDTEGINGRLSPLTGLKGGLLTIDVDGSAPKAAASGQSPWAGMSGAALFSGPLLIGVIHADPANYGTDRLVAVPMSAIAAAPGFHELVAGLMGRELVLSAVEEALTDALRPRLRPVLDGHTVFGGRDAELERLDVFAARPDPGYLFVTAPSGLGKTALLVNWLDRLSHRSDGPSLAYTFINRGRDGLADEDFTLRNLSQQLGWLRGEFGALPASTAEVRSRYAKLLVERPDGQHVVVVIDGLDEASGWAPAPDLFPHDLAAGTHVVFSAREHAEHTAEDWIRELGLGEAAIDRLPLTTLGRAEIERLLDREGVPAWARKDGALDAMLDVSAGDPFYLRFLVEDLKGATITSEAELRARPTGLADFFAEWSKQVGASARAKPVRDVLGYLLVSLGPLTSYELAQISDDDELDEFTLEDAKNEVGRFIVGDAEHGYALTHPRFQDYLAGPGGPLQGAAGSYRKLVLEWVTGWREHRSPYALRHVIAHLAESTGTVEQLAALVTDDEFHRAHADVVGDLPRLQRDLELALDVVAGAQAAGFEPVLEAALGLERFRAGWLRPEAIFDLAMSGRLEDAERRLALFDAPERWQQVARLVIVWIAADFVSDRGGPPGFAELKSQVVAELGDWAPLPMLHERIEKQLGERSDEPELRLPYEPFELPPAPPPADAERIVARMGGTTDPAMRRGLGRARHGPYGDAAPSYVAERDAPALVAFAVAHPGPGDELLARYIGIHASNPYAEYRNRSLWRILGAAACHPDPWQARLLVSSLAEGALAASPVAFREGLHLTLTALRARAGDADAIQRFDALAEQATTAAEALDPPHRTDSWGNHCRRLAALAEAEAVGVGRQSRAATLLATARRLPFGFAGYSSSAYLTLAEAHLVCAAGDVAVGAADVKSARVAAHNIQDPAFCALRTARVNAMLGRWWRAPIVDVAALIERFVGDPHGAEFSPVHVVGEEYEKRHVGGGMMEIPDTALQAATLRAIADSVYQLSPSAVHRLQPGIGQDETLSQGTPVAVPDRGFAPVLAARLAAEALASPTLAPHERIGCIRRLVPLAADSPTAMHAVLTRLVLAALPDDAAVLDGIDELAPWEWMQEPDAADADEFGPA